LLLARVGVLDKNPLAPLWSYLLVPTRAGYQHRAGLQDINFLNKIPLTYQINNKKSSYIWPLLLQMVLVL